MLTGRHLVRDVNCKQCSIKLGWFYEFAVDQAQNYKEGHYILERALIVEQHGLESPEPSPVMLGHQNNVDLYL